LIFKIHVLIDLILKITKIGNFVLLWLRRS